MGWIAGYHNTIGERHDEIRPTWAEAREVMVDELDQRIMAIEAEPSGAWDGEELHELRAARKHFGELNDGDQGAADASGLTFVLVPESALAIRSLTDEVFPAGPGGSPMTEPLFRLGQLVATPGAITVMEHLRITPIALLSRHVSGDWGDIHPEDKGLNEQALRYGDRILSVYGPDGDDRLWVITEADRSATTILRPEDY